MIKVAFFEDILIALDQRLGGDNIKVHEGRETFQSDEDNIENFTLSLGVVVIDDPN